MTVLDPPWSSHAEFELLIARWSLAISFIQFYLLGRSNAQWQ